MHQLRLGPYPRSAALEREVNRSLRADYGEAPIPAVDGAANMPRPETTNDKGQIMPRLDDGLPYTVAFKTVDVKREVEKVRESRKRIRLGPEAFTDTNQSGGPVDVASLRQGFAAKPSVCMFTLHDAGDLYA